MKHLKTIPVRNVLLLVFFFISTASWSVEKADSSVKKLLASASVSLNSNGIASIPAFSLEKPAIMASISLVKGRFSYSPILAYGLDLKPWFIDNWLHYKLIRKPDFELRAGFNISTFFSNYKLPDETIFPYSGISGIDYAGNFDLFLQQIKTRRPFFFWFGAQEPFTKKSSVL